MSDNINLKILSGKEPNAVAAEIVENGLVSNVTEKPELPVGYPGTKPNESEPELVVDIDTAGKLKIGAVARLIALIVAAINQFCAIFGLYQIPNIGEAGTNAIALLLSIAATGAAYWYNNSWTGNANLCDVILNALDAQDISIADILEVLAKISKTKETKDNK